MASVSVLPVSGVREPSGNTVAVERLPDELNDMKIRDDRVSDLVLCYIYHLLIVVYMSIFV